MSLIVRLFGNPEAIVNNQLTLISNQQTILLAHLISQSQPIKRVRLASMLYPKSKNPRGNLASMLMLLQKQVGYGHVEATRSSLQINRHDSLEVDLWDWWEQTEQLQQLWLLGQQDQSQLIQRHENLLRLYRGDFLFQVEATNSIVVDNWLSIERVRHQQTYIAHVEKLLQLYQLEGVPERQISLLEVALGHAPQHEAFQLAYMRQLARMGEAQRAINWGVRMQEKLDVAPSEAFEKMLTLVRRSEVAPRVLSPDVSDVRFFAPTVRRGVFGRSEQTRQITTTLLNEQNRLMTLVGLGGIGKTTLAMSVAQQIQPILKNGVCWVSFTDVEENDNPQALQTQIVEHIARAMRIKGPSATLETQVLTELAKYELLLVLNNYEALARNTTFITKILKQTSRVRILVTSRVALRIPSAIIESVQGLSTSASHPSINPSVALFVHRARAQHVPFELNAVNQKAIHQICRDVGGIPLAIELAAQWINLFSPAEIQVAIERRLGFLVNLNHDAAGRHPSIEAILNHTWQQLAQPEQQMLAELTIFQDEFHRTVIEQVCTGDHEQLLSLTQYSLIQVLRPGWFSLHPLVRKFVQSKLTQAQQSALEQLRATYAQRLSSADEAL